MPRSDAVRQGVCGVTGDESRALQLAWAVVYHGQRMMPAQGTTEELVSIARALDEVALPEGFDMGRAIALYRKDAHFHSVVDIILREVASNG